MEAGLQRRDFDKMEEAVAEFLALSSEQDLEDSPGDVEEAVDFEEAGGVEEEGDGQEAGEEEGGGLVLLHLPPPHRH